MFENGCFLRRQKRFKCPRREMMRRNSRTSTNSGCHVDEATSSVVQTSEHQVPPGQSSTSGRDNDDRDDIKPALEQLLPLPGVVSAAGNNVNLLQAITSVNDQTKVAFPLRESSDDVVQRQGYGGRLITQQQPGNDQSTYPYYSNLSVFQQHQYHQLQQQPQLATTSSSGVGYSKPSALFTGPEVLTATTSFPVYDVLQRHCGGGVGIDGSTSRLTDQLQTALGYQFSSPQFQSFPEVHRHLRQPSFYHHHHHPVCDVDHVSTMAGITANASAPSFGLYHAAQTHFDGGRSQPFRSSAISGSSHQQLVPRFPPAVIDTSGDIHRQNVISPVSTTLDGYHALSVLPDVQRLQSATFQQ